MTMRLDIAANRAARKYGWRVQVARVLWAVSLPVFRFSPRPLWGLRAAILRLFGAKVGRRAHLHPTLRILMPWNLVIGDDVTIGDRAILYAVGQITIGNRSTVSQYAHLCAGTHDHRDPTRRMQRCPIVIGADAWVCADAFIGPGVRIGAGAILGARAVAMRDLPAGCAGIGNPMRVKDLGECA